MNDNNQKLHYAIPKSCKQYISLNILLSEKSNIDDNVKKEVNVQFPDNYYNFAYHTRILKKRIFYKIICIKQLL